MMRINAKVMPINDNCYNYSCLITVVELVYPIVWGSYHAISCHITPLIFNSLRGGDTHMHANTHTQMSAQKQF